MVLALSIAPCRKYSFAIGGSQHRQAADRRHERLLLRAPLVDLRVVAHAADRAALVAGLHGLELLAQIVEAVVHEILAPELAGLRAPTHLAELVDVEVARARATLERCLAGLEQARAVVVGLAHA